MYFIHVPCRGNKANIMPLECLLSQQHVMQIYCMFLIILFMMSVLQIRRDKRKNLGIIFHISPSKHIAKTVQMKGHNICFH